MNYPGQLIVCDRCGTEYFRKARDKGIFLEDAPGWRLIPVPGKNNEYREMIDVCPNCFTEYCKVMDKYYENTNIKKDES